MQHLLDSDVLCCLIQLFCWMATHSALAPLLHWQTGLVEINERAASFHAELKIDLNVALSSGNGFLSKSLARSRS